MKTIKDWEREVPTECPTCGHKLAFLEMYPHEDGWTVDGWREKQWLYRNCGKCRYDWAIWKLGIERE